MLQMLRGEITQQKAKLLLAPPPKQKTHCDVGPYGVCLTHGQTHVECEKD